MPLKIERYSGKGLSMFRARYVAENYAAIRSADEAVEALSAARASGRGVACVGGGSNIFFVSRKVESFVLKNELPETIEYLGGDKFRVSSSVPMIKLLRKMRELGRDCFYYLASAPCQIGGAVAMNAGSGPKEGLSVSDYIESVEAADADGIHTYSKGGLNFGYRHSAFLDCGNRFITSAVFSFPKKAISGDPIAERIAWAKENQDLSAPNCGSLCSRYDARILKIVRALFSFFPAGLSKKKLNWAYNRSENPAWLASMLRLIKMLHFIAGKELRFELRIMR